jgi:outer membrane lipoprotein-sorting protein
MKRTWTRWLPAAVVPAVIAAGVLAGSLPAGAADPLPAKTPEQVLAFMAEHNVKALSGTLEQTSNLGLPQLPEAGPSPTADGDDWLELLTAPHEARVYLDGPENARLQVMDRMAERDAVRQGNELWLYDSKDNTATHVTAPDHEAHEPPPGHEMPTPEVIAQKLLAAVDPSTQLAVEEDVQVAGRAAYNLVATPRATDTLVASVSVAVDGQTGLPLAVEVRAKGQEDPAFRTAFSSLALETPDPALFKFTPPPGATVEEVVLEGHEGRHGEHGDHDGKQHAKPSVTGSGWEAVVEIPAGAESRLDGVPLVQEAAVPVDGGRLFSTALVNVLLADDGRIFAGAVPLERLQAAAAAR